uniref:Uncharacterized protein n=1 Tax=Cannabis sativa TaxID=3483 RepID=A0A803QNV0_CANSA
MRQLVVTKIKLPKTTLLYLERMTQKRTVLMMIMMIFKRDQKIILKTHRRMIVRIRLLKVVLEKRTLLMSQISWSPWPKKFHLTETRLSRQDQFNEILLRKMTRMEVVMKALTKGNPNVQTPPTIDAPGRVNLKDLGTSNPRKDKGKRIVGETLKKTPSTKQQKKSKIVDQPQ